MLHQKLPAIPGVPRIETDTPDKCGFGVENSVRLGIKSFSPQQQKILKTFFIRPALDTSIVSPSGFFRIHYNIKTDKPAYDVQQVALAFDSAYDYEVTTIGFPPPLRDQGDGGDDKYDVYIHPMGRGIYGNTNTENEITPGTGTYYSYIEMDNTFSGYPTTGISAARVTAAHELNHAIQLGNYILREANSEVLDLFFYEMTSTSMEDFVFTTINDYYYYMSSGGYVNFTDKAFSLNTGYNLAVWNIYLKDLYGYSLFPRQWQLLKSYRALEAVNRSLIEKQSSFLEAYNIFGVWMYHTNYRAIPGKYFDEAENYPLVKPAFAISYNGSSSPIKMSAPVSSLSYIKVLSALSNPRDTIHFILTNFELENAINNPSKLYSSSLSLSGTKQNGYIQISPGYYFLFNSDYPYFWKSASVFDGNVSKDTQVVNSPGLEPYPAPFVYGKNKTIKFPFEGNFGDDATLQIFSVSMDELFSETVPLFRDPVNEKAVVEWNGLTEKNKKLASGVYLYVIHSSGKTYLGKMVILNE